MGDDNVVRLLPDPLHELVLTVDALASSVRSLEDLAPAMSKPLVGSSVESIGVLLARAGEQLVVVRRHLLAA